MMFVALDETLQLNLDCMAMLAPGRAVVHGWAMTPRDGGTELSVSAGPAGECPVLQCAFHPHPAIRPADPARAEAHGFTLVFDVPEEPDALVLTLAAGPALLRADLRDPRIGTDLARTIAERDWGANLETLRDAAGSAVLAGLLDWGGRPFGAFAEWLARLPVLRGRAQDVGPLAEVEALAAPSGELLLMLRAASPLPPGGTLEVAAIGWRRDAPGGPVALPLAEWHTVALPTALGGYARLDPALHDRLQAVEIVLRASPRPGEEVWLRCQPAPATVPELLAATCRGTGGLDLLQEAVRRREAAFAPALEALGALAGIGPTARPPRLALILAADDPAALRLFHVTADAFERRCDRLLVLGAVAEQVAEIFARRGRIPVATGPEANDLLRDAAGRAGVLAVEAAAFATSVAEGRTEEAFASPLEAAEVARLLGLHAVAGCAAPLADSLLRLLRLRRAPAGETPFAAATPAPGNRQAAEMVNAHLRRLWAAAQPARVPLPEPVPHG
jgi:hypothetical protein